MRKISLIFLYFCQCVSPDIPEIWKKLGNAYYINKNYFDANKCYAKNAILRNDKKLGKLFLERAKKYQKTYEQKNDLIYIEKNLSEIHE